MLTVPEAAARLGVNAETVRRWIWSGRLRARKVGTQHVIEEADLEAAAPRAGERIAGRWDRWLTAVDDLDLDAAEATAASAALPEVMTEVRGE